MHCLWRKAINNSTELLKSMDHSNDHVVLEYLKLVCDWDMEEIRIFG